MSSGNTLVERFSDTKREHKQRNLQCIEYPTTGRELIDLRSYVFDEELYDVRYGKMLDNHSMFENPLINPIVEPPEGMDTLDLWGNIWVPLVDCKVA